jgi:Zn-dependent peptidase ImmA (M78 family)
MAKARKVVRARSRDEIEELAWRARADLGLAPRDRVPAARLIEWALPMVVLGFEMRVAEHGTLGGAEAVTDLTRPIITFAPTTYDELYRDRPRARMTALHEVGHLLMHTQQHVGLAFMRRYDPRVDPEVQADMFASAFMMPEFAFREVSSIEEAMSRFGVSRDAASYRARTLGMYRQLVVKRIAPRQKKKGTSKRRSP